MRAAAYALVALFAGAGCREDDVSRSLGARCDTTDECDDRCLVPSNDFPDGFCTVDCMSSGDCPSADSECVDKEGGVCLFACSVDRNCAFLGPNWVCRAMNLRANQNEQVMICAGN